MGTELRRSHRLSFCLPPTISVLCRAEPRDDQTPVLSCPFSISTSMSNARPFMFIHTWIITPLLCFPHLPHPRSHQLCPYSCSVTLTLPLSQPQIQATRKVSDSTNMLGIHPLLTISTVTILVCATIVTYWDCCSSFLTSPLFLPSPS